ncbi:MAG: SufE family protein [Flavobacteriales bacterium]|nr:SufE family protein [Flavobacteriales bacterium]
MTIKEVEEEIIDDFDMFDDWMEKYDYIIELGKTLPIIEDKYKVDAYLVKGCQSQAWIHAELVDDKIVYTGDGDAIIAKGVMSLLFRVFSNQIPEDVVAADLDFLDQIGLKEHLSPTRANGLMATIKMMKFYAVAFNAKLKNINC